MQYSDVMNVLQSGKVVQRYKSEFYSIFLEEGISRPKWIKTQSYEPTDTIKTEISKVSDIDKNNMDIIVEGGNRWLRNRIIGNLNRDIYLINSLRCSASIDPLHMTILGMKNKPQVKIGYSGFLSLQIMVPDFTKLSWEQIDEVRSNKAIFEFRGKIKQVETLFRERNIETDRNAIKYEISCLITTEMLNEIKNLMPNTKRISTQVAINIISSFIPVPYSLIPAIATSAMNIKDHRNSVSFWITLFMQLRNPD